MNWDVVLGPIDAAKEEDEFGGAAAAVTRVASRITATPN